MLQRLKEAKPDMVKRFRGDGKSDIVLVVWDFGGQKVCDAYHEYGIAHRWRCDRNFVFSTTYDMKKPSFVNIRG